MNSQPPNWIDLAKYHYQSYTDTPPIPNLMEEWGRSLPGPPTVPGEQPGGDVEDAHTDNFVLPVNDNDNNDVSNEPAPSTDPTSTPPSEPPLDEPAQAPLRRSTRLRRPTQRLVDSSDEKLRTAFGYLCDYFKDNQTDVRHAYSTFKSQWIFILNFLHMNFSIIKRLNSDGTLNVLHPLHLPVSAKDNDVYYFH